MNLRLLEVNSWSAFSETLESRVREWPGDWLPLVGIQLIPLLECISGHGCCLQRNATAIRTRCSVLGSSVERAKINGCDEVRNLKKSRKSRFDTPARVFNVELYRKKIHWYLIQIARRAWQIDIKCAVITIYISIIQLIWMINMNDGENTFFYFKQFTVHERSFLYIFYILILPSYAKIFRNRILSA